MMKYALCWIYLLLPCTATAGLEEAINAFAAEDYATAYREWAPLAEKGDPVAQNGLCVMYSTGKGLPKDDKKAFELCCLSAEQGHAAAQYEIGWMFMGGRGVRMDQAQAYAWLWKAADQGDAHAQQSIRMLEGESNMLVLEKKRPRKFNPRLLAARAPRCR